MKVVELKPKLDCEDVAKGLRNIADDIEAGKYDFDPTMAVVVLAVEKDHKDRTTISMSYNWQTHALGKCNFFAAKGVLVSAVNSFDMQGD